MFCKSNELFAIIEFNELNIQKNIDYYNLCIDSKYKLENIIYKLAIVYMVKDEYKLAEIMLQSVALNNENKMLGTFGLNV